MGRYLKGKNGAAWVRWEKEKARQSGIKFAKRANPGNPNPNNYKILESAQIGKYLALKIQYPDCKNYEGVKVLVYADIELDDLRKQKLIDPHFSPSREHYSPMARFEPTDQGWVNALKFCSMLQSERVEMSY